MENFGHGLTGIWNEADQILALSFRFSKLNGYTQYKITIKKEKRKVILIKFNGAMFA